MRKIKLQIQLSLDGFVCGAGGEMDWLVPDWDNVVKNYVAGLTNSADTFLMGRATGEGMAVYWPTVQSNPESTEEEKWMAEKLNGSPKIVFSRTVTHINWANVRVANDIVEEVKELKREPGKDIILYGGASIVSSFISENLIDEYHLFVNPAIIGNGKTIFSDVRETMYLKLVNVVRSKTGIVILQYVPEKENEINSSIKKQVCETNAKTLNAANLLIKNNVRTHIICSGNR
ncbi:MAG TPA: dihydrofolate reductase family protein [Flavisolibacter sp.]|nr:dihydrofolate reductase family protein [Flavisolibacter sp.]